MFCPAVGKWATFAPRGTPALSSSGLFWLRAHCQTECWLELAGLVRPLLLGAEQLPSLVDKVLAVSSLSRAVLSVCIGSRTVGRCGRPAYSVFMYGLLFQVSSAKLCLSAEGDDGCP